MSYLTKRQRREQRIVNYEQHLKEIQQLSTKGYDVRELTTRQYRINGFIDIYPMSWRYIVPRINQKVNGPVEGSLEEFIDKMAGVYQRKAG
jgi:hypothetical protein